MRLLNRCLLVLGSLWLTASAFAVPADLSENYQPIVDRNPFGLRPPPPPPTNNLAAPPAIEKPKVEIFLTGIVSIGHPRVPKRVFLKTQEANNKKEPKFYALNEGVESEGIRVLSIDERARRVRIQTDAGETTLSFQTHGIAAAAAPALPMPGQPGMMPGQPGAIPQPLPGGGIPQPRNMQMQQNPYAPPGAANVNNAASPQSSYRTIPSRSVRSQIPATGGNNMPRIDYSGGGQLNGNMNQVPQQQVDPAEQYLRMHLDKAQKERQGVPMPPLPPIQ